MKSTKSLLIALFGLTVVASISGCKDGLFCMTPKGAQVTEVIALEDFTGIDLAIASDVTLHQGATQEVRITGAQNIIDNIERNVVGGVWKIKFDECVRNEGQLSIDITLPTLTEASISGSGNIVSNDTFPGADELKVSIAGSGSIDIIASATTVESSIAGSGDIHLYTEASTVRASIAGSGDQYLTGSSDFLEVDIAGSGNIRAYDLPCVNGDVSITGSGDCEIQVSDHLNVTITGSGSVRYKGSPTMDTNITGSGSVKHVQ
ncbi:MAG: head GIN domain-containing protein [Bacteroidia bacterium]